MSFDEDAQFAGVECDHMLADVIQVEDDICCIMGSWVLEESDVTHVEFGFREKEQTEQQIIKRFPPPTVTLRFHVFLRNY